MAPPPPPHRIDKGTVTAPDTQPGTVPPAPLADDDLFSAQIEVSDPRFGSIYPVLQWVNGDPTKKREGGIGYHGGWFVSAEAQVTIPGAEPYTLITRDGDEIEGFSIRNLKVSVIRYRRCWQVTPNKGLPVMFAWNEYEDAGDEGAARGRGHVLVGIDGLDEPVVLTTRGFATRAMLAAGQKGRGSVPSYAQKIVQSASRLAKLKGGKPVEFPLCAFRLTIGPAKNGEGEPEFTEVGSKQKSKVTLPTWIDEPKQVDENLIRGLFVGNTRLALLQKFHKEADEWVAQWSQENLQALRTRSVKPAAAVPGNGAEGGEGLPASGEMPF